MSTATGQLLFGFRNGTDLVFSDISSEKYREYIFPNGAQYKINAPVYINVSKSGGHRIYSADGVSHYVNPSEGWAIRWEVSDGQPNFVK